jgi:formylmethanofuran dehydrogenase subunit B
MQSKGQSTSGTIEHVVCPACGLLCDDLTITRDDNGNLSVSDNACAKGVKFFKRPPVNSTPRINGNPASLQEAVAQTVSLLDKANQPLFAGLGADVQGMRAVMRLADCTGATLDHMNSYSSMRNTLVVQNSGWMVTTLTEVRNRVDLLLVIGTDIVSYNPRFFERVVWNTESMFDQDTSKREVIYLGGRNLDTSHGVSPNGVEPTILECDPDQLPNVIAALRALVANKALQATNIGGLDVADLEKLAQRLKDAKYSVIAWVSSALDFPHADLTIQNITETVIKLNETTRSSGLPLGGSEGDYSVNQTSTWISGYPVRNSLKQGFPEYDPWQFDTERILNNDEADALLWISSFSPEKTPPSCKTPTIVIGHPEMQFDDEPAVFIPISTPGLDQAGTMFRIDSSVTLPLTALRPSALPSLTEVVDAIVNAKQPGQEIC